MRLAVDLKAGFIRLKKTETKTDEARRDEVPAASMHVPLLDLTVQYRSLKAEIRRAIDAVLESQRFVLGSNVDAFETDVARFCQSPHAIGVASGSDALLLALMAIGIGQGDEVITTPFTFFATAAAVVRLGGVPVFVDIDPTTLNLAAERVKSRITPRTKAIMPVHLYGQCADMAPLLALAREQGLVVIEDAAQVFGAEYLLPEVDVKGGGTAGRWIRAGAIGDLGCLSFYPSKTLGAYGDAGMVLARDPTLAERVRTLRAHGESAKYHHDLVGVNSRLDEMQAAVLRVKLRYIDTWIAARQSRAARYDQLFQEARLAGTPNAWGDGCPVMLPVVASSRTHIFYVYAVRVRQRDRLRDYLSEHGIGTEVYYPLPLHLQPCFASLGYRQSDFPAAEQAAAEALALPMFPELTEAQQVYVVQQVADFYRQPA
jgi:dTDP-4-amino-4,6-dideoxygalactose transaminase